MIKLLLTFLIFTNLTFALEATDCLKFNQTKIINISNEVVFDVNSDCLEEENDIEISNLAHKIFPYGEITNLSTQDATIDDALNLLKDTDSTYKETEDLIKLMDFFPSALPAKLKISKFTYSENGEVSRIGIVIIDSQNIIIDSNKEHKVITISTK